MGRRPPKPPRATAAAWLGLRERLSLYGGTLQAGALPVGGYRVRAVIPIESAASEPS